MRSLVIGLVATVGLMGLLGGQANAISCTTTQVVSLGQTISESALGAGACVLANDKLYGNFNFGNSPANGTVLFNWNLATGTHSIQLEAGYVSGTTYTGIHYEVAISGGPPGSYISMEAGDFDLSLGGASTLTKLITPVIPSGLTPVSFTCSRTFGGVQNCPQGVTFSAAQNLQDLAADITFADNGTTGAIIDTTIESITATPEPSTMVLAGTALLLLAYWGRKRLFGGRQHVPGI